MESEKYVYKRNIRVIKEFYNSDYYKTLKEEALKKAIINAIYIDPDSSDKQLYKDLSEKLDMKYSNSKFELLNKELCNNNEIKLAADAVCGWKQLYDLREGKIEWLNDYGDMRECTSAYLVWPRHNTPTINTLRYSVFRDRVDYTLYDISKFFYYKEIFAENNDKDIFEENVKCNCRLHKAYLNNYGTYGWLMSFKGFKEFIDKMKLGMFVNSNYEVFNLEEDNNSVILDYSSVYSFNETYLKNIKSKVKYSVNSESK